MNQKKTRGRKPLPSGERKIAVTFFIKKKYVEKFTKEIAETIKKYVQ